MSTLSSPPPAAEGTAAHEAELRRRLADLHRQLAIRDEEIRRLLARDEEIASLRSELARYRALHMRSSFELESIRSTRAWRAITSFWRLRARLLGG